MDRGDRKMRNRQQCSRRRGCSDKRGTVLGSLWDDDNDMILEQVADDRTRKGMVKISAVVDTGAEANALPENMMQWIPLKPSSASKSGKIFRGAGGDPIPARGERSVTSRTEEGQSRRIVCVRGQPQPDPLAPDRPQFRSFFFHSLATNVFLSFFLSFFLLSLGGLLVEFWSGWLMHWKKLKSSRSVSGKYFW